MEQRSSVNVNRNVVQQEGNDEEFFRHYPPGYRFDPYDHELVGCYLLPMIQGKPLPPNLMHHVNVYESNPDDLAERYKPQGENTWYFFTPRDKKYPRGERPSRSAKDGYWKATERQTLIWDEYDPEKIIGKQRELVFYRGDTKNHVKTNWMMHEYWVENAAPFISMRRHDEDVGTDVTMRLDPYVLCKIYPNNRGKAKEGEKEVKTERVKPAKKAHTKRKKDRKISSDDTPSSINQEISPNNNVDCPSSFPPHGYTREEYSLYRSNAPPLATNRPPSDPKYSYWQNINTTTTTNNNNATNAVSITQNNELPFNTNYTYFQNTNNTTTNCVSLRQNNELPFNTNYTYFQNTNNNNTINTNNINSYSGDWNSNTAVVSSYNNNINVGNLNDNRIIDNISLVPEACYDNNNNNELYLTPEELLDMGLNNEMDVSHNNWITYFQDSTMFLPPLSDNNNTTSDQNKLKPPHNKGRL